MKRYAFGAILMFGGVMGFILTYDHQLILTMWPWAVSFLAGMMLQLWAFWEARPSRRLREQELRADWAGVPPEFWIGWD